MMTKAVLTWPVEGGAPIEAKFYDFGGPSGGIEANIQRWISQFEGKPEVKQEELTFGTTKVVLLTASGTYLDGGSHEPHQDSAPRLHPLRRHPGRRPVQRLHQDGRPQGRPWPRPQADFKKLATSPVAK